MGRSASVVKTGLRTQCAIRKVDAGLIGSAEGMETTPAFARPFARRPVGLSWLGGFALLALAFYAAVALLQPIVAAIAGAGGLALLRWARAERPYSAGADRQSTPRRSRSSPIQRNDSLGFWQLPGPWADVFRFDPPGRADRADHLRRRFDPGAHRRLSRTAAHRGAEPHRDPLPVQPAA